VSLRRILLFLAIAPALLVAGTWYWLLHTESGAQWLWSQAESATGGALTAASVAGDIGSGVALQGLAFDNEAVDLDLDSIVLTARLELLPIRVVVDRADASGFSLRIIRSDKNGESRTDLHEIFARLQLPLEIVVGQLAVEDATFDGFGGDKLLSFDSAMIAGRWQDSFRIERLEATTPWYDADGSGYMALHGENEIAVDVELVVKPELTRLDESILVSAAASGSIEDLELLATVADPAATLTGHLREIGNDPAWDLEVQAPSLTLPMSGFISELPRATVAAKAHGDRLAIALEADVDFPDTDMQVDIVADYDMPSGALSADLDWQDARWPLDRTEPRVTSRTGKVTVGGSIDDWTLAGTIELDAESLPPGRFAIDSRGNRDQASVEIIEGDVLGGTIRGSAEYRWRKPRPFAATLELNRIKTAAVLPDWPAELNGNLDVSGQQEPLRFVATLGNVSGQFRDRPLLANGRIEYESGAFGVDDLYLQHGDARARLDGQLYAGSGLSFNVNVDDLGRYVDGAFGGLQAAGIVSLKPDGQYLRIDASSDVVGFRDLEVTGLRIEDRGDRTKMLHAGISATQILYGEMQSDDLVLVADIDRQSQGVELDALTQGLRTGLSLRGALDDWHQPAAWTGEISRLELNRGDFDARLQDSAPVILSKRRAAVEELCLTGARGISLCVDGSWASGEGSDIAASLSSVPVDIVNAFVDTRLEFDQSIDGEFHWSGRPDGKFGGRADLRMAAGTIVSADDPERVLRTGQSRLGFDIDGDDLRRGIVDIPLPGQGQVAAEFRVLNVADKSDAILGGKIDVDLADIGIVLPFVPVLDDARGKLRADINLGGTLEGPLIEGSVLLEDGSLSYLPIGLRVDEINLRSKLQKRGEIEMTGSFRAGEGRGQIRSRADRRRAAASGLEVTLRGHNLTIIDVPDVKAIANTDVQVNFDGNELDIGGKLSFPRARIVPRNLGTNRVYESEDVVIVAGELPDEPTAPARKTDIRINGSLDVSLGEEVVVDLGVVETSATGSTQLTWSGDPMPMANGRYDVAGEILVFGQRLEITEGSVQFPDVPADDPYLRIRAEREIFGNTQVRRAGVLVAGSLSRPTIEPYTTPATTEERALTLLVTGSDFDYERGVGAVDFGTYIAPRVYASYGIGLFENENVIRVRYDLKRGFGVTLTSGQKESGFDLSYRFER
jgi:translocation and assembly module TamB